MNSFIQWLKNLKVSSKELLLIALSTLFLLLVGLVGLYFIIRGGEAVEYLYKNRLLSVLYVNSIRSDIRAIEANLLNILRTDVPEEQHEYMEEIYKKIHSWQEDYNSYKGTPLTPYEKESMQVMDKEIPIFMRAGNRVIQLVLAGNKDKAYENYNEFRTSIGRINKKLEELAAKNELAAQKRYEEYEKLVNIATIAIPLTILLSLLLSVPLGLLISHLISEPLSKLQEKMRSVSQGDISVEPEKETSQDEIGELHRSFNIMTSNIRDFIEREQFLRNIILTSISTLQTNRVLKTVVKETGRMFNATRCYFIAYNPETQDFSPIQDYESYISSPENKDLAGLGLTEELKPYTKLLIGQEQIVAKPSIDTSNLPEVTVKWLQDYNIKSFIAAPVFFRNMPLGIIMLDFDTTREVFSQKEIDLLSTIANQSAIVVRQTKLFDETQKAKERADILRRIITNIRGSLDLNETFEILSRELVNIFKIERVLIIQFPDMQNYEEWYIRYDYLVSSNMPHSSNVQLDPKAGEYWSDVIFKKNKPIIIDNADEASISESLRYNLNVLGIKAITGIPIKLNKDVWGSLSICTSYPRHWTEDEISLLQTISDQVYLAIKQAELYSTTQQLADREATLRKIITTVRNTLDINEIGRGIVNEVGKIFKADRCFFRIYDRDSDRFLPVRIEYRPSDDVPSIIGEEFSEDEYAGFKECYKNGHLLIFPDTETSLKEPECDTTGIKALMENYNVKSNFGIPIFYEDQFLGVFVLHYTRNKVMLDENEITLLKSVADQAGIALRQAALFQETKDLADRLAKSLESERTIREILFEARQQKEHDQIFNYLLERLVDLFNVDRAIHLHFDKQRNLYVKNEMLKKQELQSILHQPLLLSEHTEELDPQDFAEIILINDVNSEIHNPQLKEYLKSRNIEAFLLYPTAKGLTAEEQEKVMSTTMLCSSTPRKWLQSEVDIFKLAVDTTSIVWFEINQRKITEETRSTFLATLTHDLRSPINAQQKALEAIITGKLGSSLNDFAEYLQDIYKANEEQLRIINNFLTLYHYESGKFELNMQPCHIQDLINDVLAMLQPLAMEKESEITKDIASDLPEISVDSGEIKRVITNLLGNAIKHTKKGTKIHVTANKAYNEILVSIHDNGTGIPEDEKPNIFQKYPTTKRKIGTGLGLYISKQIIDAHKGKIWFESEEEKGTTFYFALPIS